MQKTKQFILEYVGLNKEYQPEKSFVGLYELEGNELKLVHKAETEKKGDIAQLLSHANTNAISEIPKEIYSGNGTIYALFDQEEFSRNIFDEKKDWTNFYEHLVEKNNININKVILIKNKPNQPAEFYSICKFK